MRVAAKHAVDSLPRGGKIRTAPFTGGRADLARRMTWKRWAFTVLSFAGVLGVTAFFIVRWWRAGSSIFLPAQAHAWAIAAVLVEIATRALKITWSATAVGI